MSRAPSQSPSQPGGPSSASNSISSSSAAKIWKIGSSLRRRPSEAHTQPSQQQQQPRDESSSNSTVDLPPPPQTTRQRIVSVSANIGSSSSAAPFATAAPSQTMTPAVVATNNDSNQRQLRELAQRMRAAPQNPVHVDMAFREYARMREQCIALVRALLSPSAPSPPPATTPTPPLRHVAGSLLAGGKSPKAKGGERRRKAESAYAKIGVVPWRMGSAESLEEAEVEPTRRPATGLGMAEGKRATLGGSPLAGRRPGSATRVNAAYLGAIREWRDCLAALAEQHRTSLEHDPWPDIGDVLEGATGSGGPTKKFRVQVAIRSKSEARLRNYEAIKRELAEVESLLQAGEGGISLDREVREVAIAPRGDAVLEFANTDMAWKPVLRFRVSSHMLAEASPLFARMFNEESSSAQSGAGTQQQQQHPHHHSIADFDKDMAAVTPADLPPGPPVPFVGADGLPARLYRMPQLELDREGALTLLLHAAHMHNDAVPRDIAFAQFVAAAEVCLRYQCTAPLEVFVEHRWLPQWMHKATEDMPDGLLLISYAFGIRRLFTRMTKTVIMNIVSEKEIYDKSWPRPIKDRIRAICSAKRAQIYRACLATVDEYLRPPPPRRISLGPPATDSLSDADLAAMSLADAIATPDERRRDSFASSYTTATARVPPGGGGSGARPSSTATTMVPTPGPASPPAPFGPLMLSSTPRCPKGSHWCDATNLGWLMLVLNELQVLDTFLRGRPPQPPRSLAQLVSVLSTVPSPPHPVHAAQRVGGVCDPAPAFRSAVNDIYNSVSGLTLFDIAGRHGWGLSRHKREVPQAVLRLRLNAGRRLVLGEGLCLRLLGAAGGLAELRSLARVNRGFWETYRRHEGVLVRGVVERGGGSRGGVLDLGMGGGGGGEGKGGGEKVLTGEVEGLLAWGRKGVEGLGGGGYKGYGDSEGEEDDEEDEEDEEEDEEEEDDDGATETEAEGDLHALAKTQPADSAYPMTDEEARRILWPDPEPHTDPPPPPPSVFAAAGVPGLLRSDGGGFVEGKTLVVADGKQLRDERDRIVGLFPGSMPVPHPQLPPLSPEGQGWI